MSDPHNQLRDALSRIRRTTVEALSTQPKVAKAAARILKDVDVVEHAVRALTERLTIENPRVGKPRKAVVVSHYSVEHMPSEGGDALTEHRTSGAQPFRCPRDVYMAAVKALGSAMAPLKFGEFQKAAETRARKVIPIYQLRLCLRFWGTAGLIQHRRARFVPVNASGFEAAAVAALKGIATRPLVVE